jgi:hypothetical protein
MPIIVFSPTSTGAIVLYSVAGALLALAIIRLVLLNARKQRVLAEQRKQSSYLSALPSSSNNTSFRQLHNAGVSTGQPLREPWMGPRNDYYAETATLANGSRYEYHAEWPKDRMTDDAEMNALHHQRHGSNASIPLLAQSQMYTKSDVATPQEHFPKHIDLEQGDARSRMDGKVYEMRG